MKSSVCCLLFALGLVVMATGNPTHPDGGVSVSKIPQPGSARPEDCVRANEFYDCGSACQRECATLREPCRIVNIKCNEWCYCREGYARDGDYNCIPISQCPTL